MLRRGIGVSRGVDRSMRPWALRKDGLRCYGRGRGRGRGSVRVLLMRRLYIEIGAVCGLSIVGGWMGWRVG